jgi:hypothetical protein
MTSARTSRRLTGRCVSSLEVGELRLWMYAARLEAHEPEDGRRGRAVYARQADMDEFEKNERGCARVQGGMSMFT